MNEILDSELNSVFASPEREFMGEALAPYTEGSRLLLLQAKTDDDVPLFCLFAHPISQEQERDNQAGLGQRGF